MTDPANPTRPSDWRSTLGFVVLAALVHVALLPLLEPLLPLPEPYDGMKKRQKIRLVGGKSPREQKVRLPKAARIEREKKKRTQPDREELTKLDGQVVDVPPMVDDVAPEDSEFLSEYNTKVERETVSRFRRSPTNAVTNELTKTAENGANAPQKNTALRIGPEQPDRDKKSDSAPHDNVFELPRQAPQDRLALALDPLGRFKNQRKRERLPGVGKQLRLSLNGDPGENKDDKTAQAPAVSQQNNFVPSVGVLAKIAGAPMNDHIDGVDEGDGTFLNTHEFKYASFFNRMKRGIAQHWRPQSEYRRRDPTGNVYGVRSRTTVLQVTLTPDGSVEDIDVTQSSGLDFLDYVAVSAMQSAQPFPNPPRGMLNEDGFIVFGFGFTLDFSNRGIRLPF